MICHTHVGLLLPPWRLTSSTLGQLFQLHIWLLVDRLFIDIRQTVRARVPIITSHGWAATNRPWSRNSRANMVSGYLLNLFVKEHHPMIDTQQDKRLR